MTSSRPSIHLDFDPQNPAQFFACCGVFELAAMCSNSVIAILDYKLKQPRRAYFRLENSFKSLTAILQMLKQSKATAPEESGEAPVTLQFAEGISFVLDWWLNADRSGTSRFKLWAGNQTTLKSLVLPMLAALPDKTDDFLFNTNKVPMSGRFGIDPRSSWNTRGLGFSADALKKLINKQVFTYPAVEMLAAIGLQGFRPTYIAKRKAFEYHFWSVPLPVAAARAAVAGAFPVEGRSFSFTIEKRSGAYSCFSFANPSEENSHV